MIYSLIHNKLKWLRFIAFAGILLLNVCDNNDKLYAQICDPTVPTFNVDLTGNPSGTWVSPPTVRVDKCCPPGGAGSDRCVQFVVTLDPAAQGINFTVCSGALPPGALFYQVNCGTPTPVGTVLCLSGVGPHVITFCKPGNNENTYCIESVPAPAITGDVITADGCTDTITAFGLDQSSITWTSITPGATGDYNHYLNNLAANNPGVMGVTYTGESTVVVTPQPGYPPSISYQVCGTVLGTCSAATFCDTATVTIYPTLFAASGPDMAICNGSVVGTVITGYAIGGTTPYTYTWTGPGGFSQVNTTGVDSNNVTVMLPGTYTVTITDITGCPATSTSISVTSYNVDIIADAGPDITACRTPIPTISINGSVSATNAGIWSGGTGTYVNGATSLNLQYIPSAAELAAGSATLILTPTNTGGCPYTTDTVVILLPQFTADLTATPTHISCNGLTDGSINLTVVGTPMPFSYSWSTGATSEDISGLGVGSYTVTVTDGNGCTSTISATITEPPILTESITAFTYPSGTNISCFGLSDGSTDITIGGGSPGYTYVWNTGSTNEDLSGLPAGTYTVTATDINGCTISSSITLTEPALLTSSAITVDILCYGNSTGSIDMIFNGGSPGYSYLWNNGAITQDLIDLPEGTYTVTATDLNGCTISQTMILTQPANGVTISGVATDARCFNSWDGAINVTVNGGTPMYSYLWSNGAISEDIADIPAGSYTVTVTDASGCTYTSTAFVVGQPDAPLVLSADISNINCFGGVIGGIDLTVTGGTQPYSYQWSNGAVSQDIHNLAAGEYTVSVIDNNNCLETETYLVSQPPLLVIDADVQDNLCFGFADAYIHANVYGGVAPYSYSWNIGASVPDIDNLSPGNYVLTVTDNNGCVGVAGFNIMAATELVVQMDTLFEIFITESVILDPNASGGTGNYTYLWSPPDFLSCTSCEVTTATPYYNIEYVVLVIDANGCTDIATVDIIVKEELFIPNSFTPNRDGNNDYFSAVSKLVQTYEMLIFDRWGELIYETSKIDDGWDGTYMDNECPIGVYAYKIYVKFWSGKEAEYIGHVNLLR